MVTAPDGVARLRCDDSRQRITPNTASLHARPRRAGGAVALIGELVRRSPRSWTAAPDRADTESSRTARLFYTTIMLCEGQDLVVRPPRPRSRLRTSAAGCARGSARTASRAGAPRAGPSWCRTWPRARFCWAWADTDPERYPDPLQARTPDRMRRRTVTDWTTSNRTTWCCWRHSPAACHVIENPSSSRRAQRSRASHVTRSRKVTRSGSPELLCETTELLAADSATAVSASCSETARRSVAGDGGGNDGPSMWSRARVSISPGMCGRAGHHWLDAARRHQPTALHQGLAWWLCELTCRSRSAGASWECSASERQANAFARMRCRSSRPWPTIAVASRTRGW